VSDEQPSGGNVCGDCLRDEGLKEFVTKNGTQGQCDYCGRTPPDGIVVRLNVVTRFIANVISKEWCDPAETSPYCSEEGGYLAPTIWTEELFGDIGLEIPNDDLLDDILVDIGDQQWCLRNWELLEPSERWLYGWQRFEHVVKHQRRYTFGTPEMTLRTLGIQIICRRRTSSRRSKLPSLEQVS